MVAISRGNPRGRRGGKTSSSIVSFRNVAVLLVVIMGFRMFTMNGSDLQIPEFNEKHDVVGQLGGFKSEGKKQLRTPKPTEKKPKLEDHELMPEQHDNPDGDDDKNTEDPGKEHEQHPVEEEDEKEEPEEKKDTSKVDLNPIVVEKKGTGPTNVGYVKDFVHERANPAYKTMGSPSKDLSAEIAKMVNEKSVLPCYDEKTGKIHPKCSDHDTAMIAYNSESFVRTWCGQEIEPKSALMLTDHCDDPMAHLFPAEVPPITGDHMPPIVIKTSETKETHDLELEQVQCDVPCELEKGNHFGFDDKRGKQYFIDGTPWKIKMDDKKMDRTDYKNDQYYSSQSLWSSVPLSHYDPKLHSLKNRPAVDFDAAQEKAIYLVSDNCAGKAIGRGKIFDAVKKEVTVDSFGKCGHNAEVPEGMTIDTLEGRIKLAKKYRIILGLDIDKNKDHITDVVWEAFLSGAVPVIAGAENIATRFPPKSFINAKMFDNNEELAEHVKEVMTNKEVWLSYQAWRSDESAIEKVDAQNYFAGTEPTCRLCRWAYAKKYGLGWDHVKQELRPISKVPKDKFCTTADHALVSKPFSEVWVTKGDNEVVLEEDSDGESCSSLSTEGSLSAGSSKISRKVYHHDGVTDFFITESTGNEESALLLKFPGIRNADGACFFNTHTLVSTDKGTGVSSASIQDDLVKITVLANWDTTVNCLGEGTMEIKNDSTPLSDTDIPRRVRIIIEELNPIFDKMTEFVPSSFCEMMTKDFIDPVGFYFADS